MAAFISRLSGRAPNALLALLVLALVVLGAYAIGVPERLALGGGQLGGSESANADQRLSDELGYEAQPAYLVILSGAEPITAPSSLVAVESVRGQISLLEGVAEVVELAPSPNGLATLLAIHLESGLEPDQVDAIGGELRSGLDPGALELGVGGSEATQQAARSAALDQAPRLLAIVLPLLILLLAGSLGLRAGLAALIGAGLAGAAVVAAIGALGEAVQIQALAVAAAAPLAVVLAVQSGAALLFRYREESATLGGGSEALEYSIDTLLRGALTGIFSVALVGGALLVIPVDAVRSIGAGVLAAALLGPPLGLLPMAAAISLRAAAEVGQALPLVQDDAQADDAPRSFRALLALGRGRRRGLIAVLPLLVVVALAAPLLDSEAIGLSASELPAGEAAAEAGVEIAGAYGAGAAGPLLVVVNGPGEAPAITLYRDEIAALPSVAAVGRATSIGSLAAFDASPDSLPQSLAAQRAAAEVAAVPAPTPRQLTGPAAELRDAGTGLGEDLPLAGLLALLGTAALWSLLFRSAFGPLLALSALIAPLAGLAAVVAVFGGGLLTAPLDYAPAGAPHIQTYFVAGSVLLAIGLARGADLAAALREERLLGGGAAGSLARSGMLTLMPIAVATIVGVAVSAVWLGSDLLPAKELGLGLSVGLLADLVLARTLLAPALARLAI